MHDDFALRICQLLRALYTAFFTNVTVFNRCENFRQHISTFFPPKPPATIPGLMSWIDLERGTKWGFLWDLCIVTMALWEAERNHHPQSPITDKLKCAKGNEKTVRGAKKTSGNCALIRQSAIQCFFILEPVKLNEWKRDLLER